MSHKNIAVRGVVVDSDTGKEMGELREVIVPANRLAHFFRMHDNYCAGNVKIFTRNTHENPTIVL